MQVELLLPPPKKEVMNEDMKYVLVMFPYPSGDGLHIGHAYNYMVVDSYCRWHKFRGHDVFQPFGYDAFGLPAENHARKIGGDPRIVTEANIVKFRSQMDRMNTQYEEILTTSDPVYYKWTQWVFTKMVEHGIAYKKDAPVNHCDDCETVLANEQVKDGRCDRCGNEVTERVMNQWFLKITDYTDRLVKGLDKVDYPEGTKKMQRNWLENQRDWCVSRQRKWGCPIPVEGETDTLDTFVDSSFYWLRYLDPNNEQELVSMDKVRQVDLYVGGPEHACMHLIYARFVNMFLHDIGVTPHEEPFKKVFHQGMIKYQGEKMSKSRGNVVNPDDCDPDELRLYLMFLGPYADGGDWGTGNMKGVRKFIYRMDRWLSDVGEDEVDVNGLEAKIDANVRGFRFNKIVSDMMTFYNNNKEKKPSAQCALRLKEIFECFAPGFVRHSK